MDAFKIIKDIEKMRLVIQKEIVVEWKNLYSNDARVFEKFFESSCEAIEVLQKLKLKK